MKGVICMYKLKKDTGITANVMIVNTDTKASIMIGKFNAGMKFKLEKLGIELPEWSEAWDIAIDDSTAKTLVADAVKITRPTRKVNSDADDAKQKINNKQIDAMDVLLGLAQYSR